MFLFCFLGGGGPLVFLFMPVGLGGRALTKGFWQVFGHNPFDRAPPHRDRRKEEEEGKDGEGKEEEEWRERNGGRGVGERRRIERKTQRKGNEKGG